MRYLSAAEQAQVGGDWYDAFTGPDGSLVVVVGDVTGHDRRAVAAMAQVRNLLRGVSYAMQVSPARVLSALDQAMHGLSIGAYAHAVTVEPGSSIVFYTDGLVERGRIPLQEALEWLIGVLDGRQGLSAEELCDHLLARGDDTVGDDVALLVLRV